MTRYSHFAKLPKEEIAEKIIVVADGNRFQAIRRIGKN